jgi:Phytanoyl-CoA dioxygenase (PhyH)
MDTMEAAQTEAADRALFDEAAYLRMYPDIVEAIARGYEVSAWDHYARHGRAEGRQPNDFDAVFYLRAYPLAAQEIAAGRAAYPLDHFRRLGRARGYLPQPLALRPDNAAAPPRFGGLWPDLPNGEDLIEGKLETGCITERQAELLRFWRANGYVILRGAASDDLTARATADLDHAYAGGFPEMLFECHPVSPERINWHPDTLEHPAKALDIHYFSPATRELMFCPAVTEFLDLVFESHALASQTLGFLRGSAQEGHQDSAYVPYTIGRAFAASWIALEDVTLGAGELFYYPGSHRFADFLYAGTYKSVHEAMRVTGEAAFGAEVGRHVASLEERAVAQGLARLPFAARRGDALIWHADLVHGGNPVSRNITRKSVVTHYCPKRLTPLFSEREALKLFDHRGHSYTSGHYPALEPVGLTLDPVR